MAVVVALAPDATVVRVLSTCSSFESGSLGVATTADGTIYFVRSREIVPFEEYRYELVRVPPGGASDGGVVHSGGPATQATLNDPRDVAQGPAGVIHVADFGNDRVRRIAPDGTIR